ncbi:NAD(P)/FAD-dependent oxidoreductase [Mycobacterium kyorinense]|uniref:NAD(P)/FAD-dependent oxidoreductase n=1 Tax=Mycobacterium kyorinense TaxID=487514 RepID=UPI001E579E46|nr:FAD-binding oxidoreductase [Mycobacterium kyorinense]
MLNGADVGVVGAGIVGLSTAWALTEAGASVRVYERGVPGNGQSGGESRIFRHAHDDPRLVAFARDSRAVWDEWAERLGSELVSGDGAVAIGSAVERRLPILEQAGGVRVRRIGSDELAERLPVLAGYAGPAMLDEAGGAIRVRAAIDALTEWIGDSLVADEVITIRPTRRDTVEVVCGGSRTEHARVVVCAGRETARLARSVGLALPVRLAAHARLTFEVRHHAPLLSCLQDSSGEFGETGIYAAATPGNRCYAVGLSEAAAAKDDGSFPDPAGLVALADRAGEYARRALPGLDPRPVDARYCWVTTLPWSDDGFAVWEREGLFFVAGHNLFKQAPALGRALARLALGEDPGIDLRAGCELGRAPAESS